MGGGYWKIDILGNPEQLKNPIQLMCVYRFGNPTDIKGIPYYAANDNVMAWAPPAELPTEEFAKKYDYVVLFLDEMNPAAPAVQAAAYLPILTDVLDNTNCLTTFLL